MNLYGIRVTTERPDEFDPKHATVTLAGTAYHDPPKHAIPEHVTDEEYFAARVRVAGILARVAVLALPHLEAERRDHGCGNWYQGEPLTAHPGYWDGTCGIGYAELEPNGDGSGPVTLYLDVPGKRSRAWAAACKEWLAEVNSQDVGYPPAPELPAATVHSLRGGAA